MGPNGEVGAAYAGLLAIGEALALAGSYEAAYHTLMGAMHCAADAGDAARLAEVAQLLRQHRQAVDALAPPHRLSTQASHSGRSIFEIGAVTAEAVIQRLENQQRLKALGREGLRPE